MGMIVDIIDYSPHSRAHIVQCCVFPIHVSIWVNINSIHSDFYPLKNEWLEGPFVRFAQNFCLHAQKMNGMKLNQRDVRNNSVDLILKKEKKKDIYVLRCRDVYWSNHCTQLAHPVLLYHFVCYDSSALLAFSVTSEEYKLTKWKERI